jgi:hypothetical protein
MKFYYVEWDDYSFHEIEGEYVEVSRKFQHRGKYAKLEGLKKPVPIDYDSLSIIHPNYSSSLEKLRNEVIKWVEGHILYHKYHLEQTEKTLGEIKNSLECLERRTKHLFEVFPQKLHHEPKPTLQEFTP